MSAAAFIGFGSICSKMVLTRCIVPGMIGFCLMVVVLTRGSILGFWFVVMVSFPFLFSMSMTTTVVLFVPLLFVVFRSVSRTRAIGSLFSPCW